MTMIRRDTVATAKTTTATAETPAERLARTMNAAMDETVRRYRTRMAAIEARDLGRRVG